MSGIIKEQNIHKIKEILPNRYPFLLIDYIVEVVPGQYARAYKNLTANEWFFPVHFPEEPVMPGMIQVEALLQTLSLAILSMDENRGKAIRCLSANKIRLKKKVVPGERIDIVAEIVSFDSGVAKGIARGMVSNEEVCTAELVLEAVERNQKVIE